MHNTLRDGLCRAVSNCHSGRWSWKRSTRAMWEMHWLHRKSNKSSHAKDEERTNLEVQLLSFVWPFCSWPITAWSGCECQVVSFWKAPKMVGQSLFIWWHRGVERRHLNSHDEPSSAHGKNLCLLAPDYTLDYVASMKNYDACPVFF